MCFAFATSPRLHGHPEPPLALSVLCEVRDLPFSLFFLAPNPNRNPTPAISLSLRAEWLASPSSYAQSVRHTRPARAAVQELPRKSLERSGSPPSADHNPENPPIQ